MAHPPGGLKCPRSQEKLLPVWQPTSLDGSWAERGLKREVGRGAVGADGSRAVEGIRARIREDWCKPTPTTAATATKYLHSKLTLEHGSIPRFHVRFDSCLRFVSLCTFFKTKFCSQNIEGNDFQRKNVWALELHMWNAPPPSPTRQGMGKGRTAMGPSWQDLISKLGQQVRKHLSQEINDRTPHNFLLLKRLEGINHLRKRGSKNLFLISKCNS